MSDVETREQAIERANQQIVEQMHEEFDKKRMALPPAPEESQRGGAISLRTFIREENNKLLEAFRDMIKREIAEGNREIKREIGDIKKLIG